MAGSDRILRRGARKPRYPASRHTKSSAIDLVLNDGGLPESTGMLDSTERPSTSTLIGNLTRIISATEQETDHLETWYRRGATRPRSGGDQAPGGPGKTHANRGGGRSVIAREDRRPVLLEQARRLGVSGVPFFVVNGRVAFSSVQPPELFRQAFEQAGGFVMAGEACEDAPTSGKRGF